MIERFLIVLLVTAVILSLLFMSQWWHKRRIENITQVQAGHDNRPTVLYFRGDSCALCATQTVFLEKLATEWGAEQFSVRTIDAEKERDTAVQYAILTLPTTIILNGRGDVQQINYGLTNNHKLAQQLGLKLETTA